MKYALLIVAFLVGSAILALVVAFAGNAAVQVTRSVAARRRRGAARGRAAAARRR